MCLFCVKGGLIPPFTHQPEATVRFKSLINLFVQCIVHFNKKHERRNFSVFKQGKVPTNKLLYFMVTVCVFLTVSHKIRT